MYSAHSGVGPDQGGAGVCTVRYIHHQKCHRSVSNVQQSH